MDPEKHKQGTGLDNALILHNAERIKKELGMEMSVRFPLIPGYNDSDENIKATALFVAEHLGKDVRIHLLPYHRLGESKHERMEDGVATLGLSSPTDEEVNVIRDYLASFGLDVTVGG